jgi:Hemolysin coregulated protein Hcp (TssD)
MSFLAHLKVEDTTYNILECSYNLNQSTDSSGKPQGVTRGGKIKIKVEATGKSDLINWMISPNKSQDGIITFYKRDAMSRLQEVKFEKGYCIDFTQIFNAQDKQPLMIEMLISAKKLSFDGNDFENIWKL